MPLTQLLPVLQIAIGPVILISGIGLLLLAMTNRFGRVIDRARQLTEGIRDADQAERALITAQLDILNRRGHLVRLAILLATISALLAAVLVISLFLSVLLRWEEAVVVAGIFIGCMITLIASLVMFLRDIDLSLAALKLEVAARTGAV